MVNGLDKNRNVWKKSLERIQKVVREIERMIMLENCMVDHDREKQGENIERVHGWALSFCSWEKPGGFLAFGVELLTSPNTVI